MKSSIYLCCRYWRLGHCFVKTATEHYYEDAFARVGMTSCKSVVTPGVNDVASNFLREKARLSFEGLLLSIEAVCQRNSMFLTHSASRSNSVVWRLIQSCHVFFCAARDDRRLVVESLLCVSAVVPFSVILRVDAHSAMAQGKRVSLAVIHTTRCLVVFGVFFISPCLDMYHGSGDSLVWRWILRCMNLWLVLWTRQDLVRFYVSSVYLVINTELCLSTEYRIWTQISRVHSPVVKAADCRSAGPWFKSGWKTLFTFVTWYDKLTNHDFLMINIMSPITTSIRTITRKSVNKNWLKKSTR